MLALSKQSCVQAVNSLICVHMASELMELKDAAGTTNPMGSDPNGATETSFQPAILIVGSGPAGITAASNLHRYGIAYRIIEKHTEAEIQNFPDRSRAVTIYPLTAEMYQTMGVWGEMSKGMYHVDDAVFYQGTPQQRDLLLHITPHDLDSQIFLSPNKRLLTFCQSQEDITECIRKDIGQHGGRGVEFGVEFKTAKEVEGGIVCTLFHHGTGKTEELKVRYLLAADGSRSPIRNLFNLPFDGSDYPGTWCIMDNARLPFEYKEERAHSIQQYVPPRGTKLAIVDVPISYDKVRYYARDFSNKVVKKEDLVALYPKIFEGLGYKPVPTEADFANNSAHNVFHTAHRCAPRWRTPKRAVKGGGFIGGSVFLMGDSAHVNSPILGQGSNLAYQDAFCLSWKLAMVIKGLAKDEILDTYTPERRKVARQVNFTSLLQEMGLGMSQNCLLRGLLSSTFKWKRGRGIIGHMAAMRSSYPYSSPLSVNDGAPRSAIKAGSRCPVSNRNYKPGVEFVVYTPSHLAARAAAATDEKQAATPLYVSSTYKPNPDDLNEVTFFSFVHLTWAHKPMPLHCLMLFGGAGLSTRDAATIDAKIKAFLPVVIKQFNPYMRVIRVIGDSPACDAPFLESTFNKETEYAVIHDQNKGLHTLLGMQRGGLVLLRPDDFVAYVSGWKADAKRQLRGLHDYFERLYTLPK